MFFQHNRGDASRADRVYRGTSGFEDRDFDLPEASFPTMSRRQVPVC